MNQTEAGPVLSLDHVHSASASVQLYVVRLRCKYGFYDRAGISIQLNIEDMIKEVDVDGDGRIDFYEFVNALGEPGTEDSYDDEDEDIIGY
ncbi:unnamed protein product [Acanthoscelides obtectus]|uniref:EF-hand domain-containing protein n=1 Tax=Acanthoscelides obtectus TaxID=200917 RepID=A0A9P0PT53_ACAOB|nr:unnamed protein product [Acanthoscelides obtectus]CAK1660800.1 hypothetical protein AOBTE_LOCUS22268 [Acanthoscelides obtectus]